MRRGDIWTCARGHIWQRQGMHVHRVETPNPIGGILCDPLQHVIIHRQQFTAFSDQRKRILWTRGNREWVKGTRRVRRRIKVPKHIAAARVRRHIGHHIAGHWHQLHDVSFVGVPGVVIEILPEFELRPRSFLNGYCAKWVWLVTDKPEQFEIHDSRIIGQCGHIIRQQVAADRA